MRLMRQWKDGAEYLAKICICWYLLLPLLIDPNALLSSAIPQSVKKVARVTDDISLDGCASNVNWHDAQLPNELDPSKQTIVYWLRSLFRQDELDTIVKMLDVSSFGTHGDSTDSLPAYEMYLNANSDQSQVLKSFVMPRIESCVMPFVRKKYDCPECVPCVSIARRYNPNERSFMVAHRDTVSSVTVVVELKSAQPQPSAGGLFIKSSQQSDPAFPSLRPGDAFIHNYELLHGVSIDCGAGGRTCGRYSLVVWFQDDEGKCRAGGEVEAATNMYRRSADAGVPEGQYSWARHIIQMGDDHDHYEVHVPSSIAKKHQYHQGNTTTSNNNNDSSAAFFAREAHDFLHAAARQGHAESALMLAELNLEGVPGTIFEFNPVAAQVWLEIATSLGSTNIAAWNRRGAAKLTKALSLVPEEERIKLEAAVVAALENPTTAPEPDKRQERKPAQTQTQSTSTMRQTQIGRYIILGILVFIAMLSVVAGKVTRMVLRTRKGTTKKTVKAFASQAEQSDNSKSLSRKIAAKKGTKPPSRSSNKNHGKRKIKT